ncbi:MAG: RNA 2',3'-cyclic phosphodiesterase [Syntrophorhabdaceae bacterium]|nr:RNA 2',3'-cyclic phosphodiesterase [Syntrophorhabdaceae bacterium]
MRSFLAFEIPAEVKGYLSEVSKAMARTVPGVRWVRPEGQHITIRFFGEISGAKAQEIKDVLGTAGSYPGVEATLKHIDAFPDKRRPRVIVAVLDEGVDIIGSIYHDIENRLTALGYEREKRGFTPHITFGRMKMPAPLLGRDMPPLEYPRFTIERIVLYKSILGREGATYEPLFEKRLGASG